MKAFIAKLMAVLAFIGRVWDGIAERRRQKREIKRREMEELAKQKYREAQK